MNTYKLSDLILYMQCPLKAKLHAMVDKPVPANLDHRTAISTALSDTYLKACHMYAQKRAFTLAARTRYFSKRWDQLKGVFEEKGGGASRVHAQLTAAHATVLNMDNLVPDDWDMALIDFPFDRVIGKSFISDKLDLVLVNRKKTSQIKIILMDSTLTNESEKDYGTLLRALFCYTYFRRELSGTPDVNVKCFVKNLHHDYEREVTLRPEDRMAYRRVITNIITAMEAGVYYPRASVESCKHCLHNLTCEFSLS